MTEHGWQDCRPAVLAPEDLPLTKAQAATLDRQVAEVWKTFTEQQRTAYHTYMCLNVHDDPEVNRLVSDMLRVLSAVLPEVTS